MNFKDWKHGFANFILIDEFVFAGQHDMKICRAGHKLLDSGEGSLIILISKIRADKVLNCAVEFINIEPGVQWSSLVEGLRSFCAKKLHFAEWPKVP